MINYPNVLLQHPFLQIITSQNRSYLQSTNLVQECTLAHFKLETQHWTQVANTDCLTLSILYLITIDVTVEVQTALNVGNAYFETKLI